MIEDPETLLARFEALPAAAPLRARLADAGVDVYLVGGAVRDLMLGAVPADLDLLVGGALDPVLARLGAESTRHARFGTAVVALDGLLYDLTQARTETYAHPGALPTVSPAAVAEDLGRRDFTVNAIALGVLGGARGDRLEVPGALEDLDAQRLRVLHDASFRDDPTRLWRLVRYGVRLGFAVEPHTLALAREALEAGAAATVSGPRLGAELWLLAAERDPVAAVAALSDPGLPLAEAIAPGFGLGDPRAVAAALEGLAGDGDRRVLVLGAALAGVAAAQRAALLDRLGYPAASREAMLEVARAPELVAELAGTRRPSEIAAVVGSRGPEAVALAGALGAGRAAALWRDALRGARLEIGGEDLLAAEIPAGPAIGRGLAAARAALLDGEAPDRQTQLSVALAAARAAH